MYEAQDALPYHLFGVYILEIAKFFSERFKNQVKWDDATLPRTLQVIYGTPREAFRFMIQQINGKVTLPMLNFWTADMNRVMTMERLGTVMWSKESFDPNTNTIAIMRSPMHFDVTFSFNLWSNTIRERDSIIHDMLQSIPYGEISLVYFPDTSVINGKTVINDRNSYLLIPIKLDPKITDETAIEGLDMKETRDAIKTVFTITAHAIVPYNIYRVPIAMSVGVVSKMQEKDINGMNEIIEKYIYPEK